VTIVNVLLAVDKRLRARSSHIRNNLDK